MKTNYFFLLTVTLVTGCISLKKELSQSGGRRAAIQNAILDFSNASRLYKKDSVFHVSFQDTLYRMTLNKLDDRNYQWVNGQSYNEIVTVSIGTDYNQFLLTENTKVGSKGELPSRFIEKDGKLFYWWDDNYLLTKEALSVYEKYDLLQDDEGGVITFPDFTVNDAQKGAHYYFCRNDLSKYKKVITNKGIGYYDPPKLNCK